MKVHRLLYLLAVLGLLAGACSGDDDVAATTAAPAGTTAATTAAPTTQAPAGTTAAPDEAPANRQLNAPVAAITVDGDTADWDSIEGLDLTLEAIVSESIESKTASVKAAYDADYVYVLLTVDDDYNWNADDAHLSASNAVMWAVESEAGPHMGTGDEEGEGPSLGMVDIWHWELECALGENMGGAVAGPGDGAAGNDSGCNFDDEWSTDPETREDDNGDGAENSLLGVFTHSNPVDDGDGTWVFEMSRPLQTGDGQDAQFAAGEIVKMALAYWDADNSVEGWDDAEHVQSSNQGWIDVNLLPGDVSAMSSRELRAPVAAITVDGDTADWDSIEGLDLTLEAIVSESIESKTASVKAAYDADYVYVLLTVDDDYNWNADDAHLSASNAVMWAVESEAGPHMGTGDEEGEGPSLGMVDIWHWELECALGENMGGAVAGPGDGAAGNDSGCNFDDEWSTDPETREDDNGDGAENSLLGVFTHSNPVDDGDGTWVFEMSRPLQTGDGQDAQFAAGEIVKMALAYWDADNSVEGWDDAEHVQSSNQGWIHVVFIRG